MKGTSSRRRPRRRHVTPITRTDVERWLDSRAQGGRRGNAVARELKAELAALTARYEDLALAAGCAGWSHEELVQEIRAMRRLAAAGIEDPPPDVETRG